MAYEYPGLSFAMGYFLIHPGMLIHCFFFHKGPIEYIVQQHLHNLMNVANDIIYISQPGEWAWYL